MSIPFQRTCTLTRSGVGAYNSDGVWVPAADVVVSVQATIQPDVGRSNYGVDVSNYESGDDSTGTVAIYSESLLIASNEEQGVIGDRFTYDNELYEIRKVNHYKDVIPHYKGQAWVIGGNEP